MQSRIGPGMSISYKQAQGASEFLLGLGIIAHPVEPSGESSERRQ